MHGVPREDVARFPHGAVNELHVAIQDVAADVLQDAAQIRYRHRLDLLRKYDQFIVKVAKLLHMRLSVLFTPDPTYLGDEFYGTILCITL